MKTVGEGPPKFYRYIQTQCPLFVNPPPLPLLALSYDQRPLSRAGVSSARTRRDAPKVVTRVSDGGRSITHTPR